MHGIDTLFTAVSALSTTGLATTDVGTTYSVFGQSIVLLLIQVGGIGYMTLGSFIVLARRTPLSRFREDVGRASFPMPEDHRFASFLRTIVVYTFVVELLGTLILWQLFRRAGVPDALWQASFHAVSSFCTAGFSLFPDSLEAFSTDFWINATVSALSLAGAIGFIVVADVWRWVAGIQRGVTITSRIIVLGTMMVIGTATLLLFVAEPTLQTLPPSPRLLAAWFQAMSASTTVGFNTVPVSALSSASTVLMLVLMVIGASPSGTGGGLKTTTITAMLGQAWSTLKGRETVTFWSREIPLTRLHAAAAATTCYLVTLTLGMFILQLTDSHRFELILFEASSALGTVGLSKGITAELSDLGKLTVTALMFVGRVGPLTIGTAVFLPSRPSDNDLAI